MLILKVHGHCLIINEIVSICNLFTLNPFLKIFHFLANNLKLLVIYDYFTSKFLKVIISFI